MPLSQYDPDNYSALLAAKSERVQALFQPFSSPPTELLPSSPRGYRMRAEFRIWHQDDDLFYAMFAREDPRTPIPVNDFPIASERIQAAMPLLRQALLPNEVLRRKLFQVEFLSTLSGQLLVTLVYHRPLEQDWEDAARALEQQLQAHIIGRSRKQKLVLSQDFVEEMLPLAQGDYHYRQYEQGFTQPNAGVNCEMINWACRQVQGLGGDLLELYCGNANFTLPLSAHFEAVLATEVAKSSIKAALHNRDINKIGNLELARLSAEEVSSALAGERQFRRLQSLQKPLEDYRFSTIFVDPPRAGLDPATTRLVSNFDNILYISCNPQTLAANLEQICKTHQLQALAMFDQFPYTDHMECGAHLRRL
ncbi:MAG: tRNA (uridine(54)-C5)-methyltransferase TrmA [Halieaceae bacterium]